MGVGVGAWVDMGVVVEVVGVCGPKIAPLPLLPVLDVE